MQRVTVEFIDPTVHGHSWSSFEEVTESKASHGYATGWLVEENKDCIKVALLIGALKQVRDWIVIPQGAVISIEQLKSIDVEGWNGK